MDVTVFELIFKTSPRVAGQSVILKRYINSQISGNAVRMSSVVYSLFLMQANGSFAHHYPPVSPGEQRSAEDDSPELLG